MNNFTEILLRLDETKAVIADLEQAMRTAKATPSLAANLRSVYKRQRELEDEFSAVANENYQDVCIYRLFAEEGPRPSISTVTRTLSDFQSLVTIVYDAIKNGPKDRATYTVETASESSFEFGYSFTGSLGFVLTMPNERLLFGESLLDRTMGTIFEMVKATSTEQVRGFVRQLGGAAIRKVSDWAEDHLRDSLNAEIKWCRHKDIKASVLIEIPELERLTNTIGQTGEESSNVITIEGQFVGGDLESRNFHLVSDQQQTFRGKMADDDVRPTLGARYSARLRKTSFTFSSTGKEDISYILLSLQILKDS